MLDAARLVVGWLAAAALLVAACNLQLVTCLFEAGC
jgi:predicted small secreted protein